MIRKLKMFPVMERWPFVEQYQPDLRQPRPTTEVEELRVQLQRHFFLYPSPAYRSTGAACAGCSHPAGGLHCHYPLYGVELLRAIFPDPDRGA